MMLNLLLALIFIRPFISSLGYPALDMCYSYFLIILSFALIKSKKEKAINFPGQGFLLLFFLIIIASAFLSFHPSKSLRELPKFLSYFFVFYATYYASQAEKKRIILTLVLAGSCVSLYAIYWSYIGSVSLLEYMQGQKIIYPFAQELLSRHRAFMPYVSPSMLAGYLIMMLPLSVGYLFKENKGYSRNVLLTLPTLLIAFALFLTKSVGAFSSISLSFLLFIVLSKRFNRGNFLILLIFLLALASIFILRSYKTEYFTSPVFSIHKRIIYWQQTLSVILRHPFRGVGLSNLPFIQSQFAHNSYLQIWAEIGLLGIVSFLGFLYKSLKAIWVKKLVTDKLYAGLLIAGLGFLIHNFIDFGFFLPEVCIFWWIIVALFLSSPHFVQKT